MKRDIYNSLNALCGDYDSQSYEKSVCMEFVAYLDRTSRSHIIAHGNEDGKETEHDFGYPHRYTKKYIKGRFKKMYLLDDWYNENRHLPVTFLTLTSKHDADYMHSLEELPVQCMHDTFKRLQKGKRLLFREMLRSHPGLQYVGVVEPHESGYPHTHFIVFGSFTIDEQIEYRKMWEKWGIGSFEHGIDFDERPDTEIKSLRNYLMKYMSKSFPDYTSKYKNDPWTKEYLLFNAVAWKYGFRTWFASNGLSRVMACHKTHSESVDWYETVLETADNGEFKLWEKQDSAEIDDDGG